MIGEREILVEARRILANGWVKGSFGPTETGACCVRGAFNQAIMNLGGGWIDVFHATERVKWHHKVIKHTSLVSWNDAPTTDQAEVLSVFDECIASV